MIEGIVADLLIRGILLHLDVKDLQGEVDHQRKEDMLEEVDLLVGADLHEEEEGPLGEEADLIHQDQDMKEDLLTSTKAVFLKAFPRLINQIQGEY